MDRCIKALDDEHPGHGGYTRWLTANERQRVVEYLKIRYGVA